MDAAMTFRSFLARALTRLAGWMAPPLPRLGTGGMPWPANRPRPPTPLELLAELKSTAWACASLNAAACASFPPRLFVRTGVGQRQARCLTRALSASDERRLRGLTQGTARVEEVLEHPLLDLLAQVNPVHNAFDIWETTTLSLEVHGVAYWLLEQGPFGVPAAVWPLPAHQVTPWREPDSSHLVDAYLFRTGGEERRYAPDEVIAFRYPDPRDPYLCGLSP